MNIFEALRESHERQRTYAKALIRTSGDTPERVDAYKQLKSELQAHETAEERHFYIPLMKFDNGVDLSRHAHRRAPRNGRNDGRARRHRNVQPGLVGDGEEARPKRSITTSRKKSRSSSRWRASCLTTNRKESLAAQYEKGVQGAACLRRQVSTNDVHSLTNNRTRCRRRTQPSGSTSWSPSVVVPRLGTC